MLSYLKQHQPNQGGANPPGPPGILFCLLVFLASSRKKNRKNSFLFIYEIFNFSLLLVSISKIFFKLSYLKLTQPRGGPPPGSHGILLFLCSYYSSADSNSKKYKKNEKISLLSICEIFNFSTDLNAILPQATSTQPRGGQPPWTPRNLILSIGLSC